MSLQPDLNPDVPGNFSIIVQGSLYDWNLVETAAHCEHWRRLFPQAEVVLAIATTDILSGSADERPILERPSLIPALQHNGLFQAAMVRLRRACDRIVVSEGALPLPPIKFDNKVNNVNLMIVAAKAGLAHVGGLYTLRIRSDMIFLDRSFIGFYAAHHDLPRQMPGAFRQRVLISPFFTLNPYALERLPFHFSDWFHLGLTGDVRALWSIAEMPLADGSHHAAHAHTRSSNRLERKFRVRIAVEQHIAFGFLRTRYPEIRLTTLTDSQSAQRSVEILLNDFLICDHETVPTLFNKYAKTFKDPRMRELCITFPLWRRLLRLPSGTDFSDFFAAASRRARREVLIREHPLLGPVRFGRGLFRSLRRLAASALPIPVGRPRILTPRETASMPQKVRGQTDYALPLLTARQSIDQPREGAPDAVVSRRMV